MKIAFDTVARLAHLDDNVAIATCELAPGTQLIFDDTVLTLSHTVLLGHRFAVRDIKLGEALRSWRQTFGIATGEIKAGNYICNADVLAELSRRSLEISLPRKSNFKNDFEPYSFDDEQFQPAEALSLYDDAEMKMFEGYEREGNRGIGTRNTIILVGVTSLVGGFVHKLEAELQASLANYPHIDGIVAIAHTEGSHKGANNQELLLKTLAGFIVHPNVGAVLIIDYEYEAVNNQELKDYMQGAYPLNSVLHHFMDLSTSFEDDLSQAKQIVTGWLDDVNQAESSLHPLSKLKIALQCGGSDAFSGISGNPLVAWVAKEVIRYGGSANLAETDELIGAESYVLDKVRDSNTAKKFLAFVARFQERVAWHGHSAEGNPSGGNKFRGLYNIYLKSLGAAMKRHPDVRLDYVIDYAERMQEPGYYFMDSPGNDLESVAGQVASGCNIIFFVTGNGSITNFPFVPTIKVVTTTERYELLSDDMDINAGAYLDSKSLDDLGAETLDYMIQIASGQSSAGDVAGHSQVQIWRDWQQTHFSDVVEDVNNVQHRIIPIKVTADIPDVSIPMFQQGLHHAGDQVGLILPTSLCSGQIARMCVASLNKSPLLVNSDISRFATLVHTEGCGSSITNEFQDTLLAYLAHPFAKHVLLLEHGCEATHNDYFREAMIARGYNPDDYGWASIQQDGGIQAVIQKMRDWFSEKIKMTLASEVKNMDLRSVSVGICSKGDLSLAHIATLAELTQIIVGAGGIVVTHEKDALLQTDFLQQIGVEKEIQANLSYAEIVPESGFYIMSMPTDNWGEILAGVGASGVQLFLNNVTDYPMPGHPMIPVLQVGYQQHQEMDIILESDPIQNLLDRIVATLSRNYAPKASKHAHVHFQITRGTLGVSL